MKTSLLKKGNCAWALVLIASAVFTSCKKDKTQPDIEKETIGAYVLAEGTYDTPTSKIDYYDLKSNIVQKDYFKTVNGYDLGTNATDLKVYGSKMYCTVTGKKDEKNSYVEVISLSTGKSLKRIPFFDGSTSFYPRSIVFHQSKAYVTCYDGYVRSIDTASMVIDGKLKVGGVLEGAAIAGNKMYVANTAHFLFPSLINSQVSVVNLGTFTKTKDISVNYSPTQISALANGDVFVQTAGDYGLISPALDKINSVSDTKTATYNVNLSAVSLNSFKPLVGTYNPETIKSIDLNTGTIGGNFITDATEIKSLYAITVNELNNDVYVSDANNYGSEGIVYAFNSSGKKQFSFASSTIPKNVVFKYNK